MSESQLPFALLTTCRNHGWRVASQLARLLVAIATFQCAITYAAEESGSWSESEGWPDEAVVAFQRVYVGEESLIQGDVTVLFPDRSGAPTEVEIGATATVDGAVRTEVVATELPSFPWFTPGGRDVLVTPGSSSSLPPGSYGRVAVGSSEGPPAVLSLTGGIHNIVSLQLGRSSRIECTEACQLRVFTTVRLDSSASLGPAQDAGVREEDIQLFVAGTDVDEAAAVQLGEAAEMRGYLYAPNGTVLIGPAANATGHIIGRTVRLERAARVTASMSFSARSPPVDQRELPLSVADGGVQTFRLDPHRQVRVEGLFVRHGTSFGLGAADTVVEQEVRGSQESGLHHRFRQFHHGLPILGADFTVQESNGMVISGIGRLMSGLDIDPNPLLSEGTAFDLALKAIAANGRAGPRRIQPRPAGMLAIASKGGTMAPGSFHLIYRFELRALGEMIDIDARTGEVVNRFALFANYTTSGGGDTLHYGWKPFLIDSFTTVEGQTRYRLRVPDLLNPPPSAGAPNGLWTVQALGLNPSASPTPAEGFIYGDYVVKDFVDEDTDFRYWPAPSFDVVSTTLPPLIYGVSVHWGLQQAVEYWKNANPPWTSQKPIVAVVDCPIYYGKSQATYMNDGQTLCFGTGSKKTVTLHAIGHEFTHLVFGHVTGSSYFTGESAEVNEGIASVFGYLLDHNTSNWCGLPGDAVTLYYKGSCNGPTALCTNEQCDPTGVCSTTYPPECTVLNLANPKATGNPDTYAAGPNWVPTLTSSCKDDPKDYCHHNSSIVSHWFYILVNGKQGTNDWGDAYNVVGIGRQKAEEIAQRTLLLKLGSSPTFFALRQASIQAAEDSGSSEVVAAVTNAWYAVGVGDPYDPRTYSPLNKVSGVEPWPAVLKWEELDGETDWEVMVSSDPSFGSDVQILAPTASEVQVKSVGQGFPSFYKEMQITKVNLKPATKYYWRVHSKSAEPLKKASGLDLTPEKKKKSPWVRPGRGRIAPGGGTLAGSVLQEPSFLWPAISGAWGAWGAWGPTQVFETGAKVPEPIAPAPALAISGQEVVAPGTYDPWNAEFSWKPVPGASRYRLTVSESPNRSCGPSSGTQITFPSNLHTTVDSVVAPKTAGTVKKEIPLKSDDTYYWWLKVYGPNDIPGGCAYGGKRIRFKTFAPKATLISPTEGSKVSPFQVTLTWNKVKGATGYVLQWGKAPMKVFPAGETVTSESKIVEPGAVGTYYWQVRPQGPLSGDMGAVSSTWFVTDIELTKPELGDPQPESWVGYDEVVGFTWHKVPGATGYMLTIHHRNTDQTAGEVVAQIDSGFTLLETLVNLKVNDVSTHKEGYCWTVKAAGPGNLAGVSSDVWCYRVGAAEVLITSPQNGANDVEYNPTILSWTCAYCPGGFRLKYYTPSTHTDCELTGSEDKDSTVTSISLSLSPDTHYCAQVIGLNPDGTEHWSGSWVQFQTKPKPQATCKPLTFGSILVQSPGQTVPQTWDRKLKWLEVSPDIKDYRVTAIAGGTNTISPSIVVGAASIPTLGQITIGNFTGNAKVFTLPGNLPWSKTELNLNSDSGYLFGVSVDGRSQKPDGGVCPWVLVGSTITGVDW